MTVSGDGVGSSIGIVQFFKASFTETNSWKLRLYRMLLNGCYLRFQIIDVGDISIYRKV